MMNTQENLVAMLTRYQQIHSLDELRGYVNETLCEHNLLQHDAFEMTERVLCRAGKPCGIFFCLHGPRAVKFTAIWETERNQVLFYDGSGERFQKTQLLEGPRLEHVAA
jgi:hypothetical protein